MLPTNTFLGKLEIFEVYEYLDGPKLFAARDNVGTMYLAFWFDEEDEATGWLYLPISETKLNKLRRKEITLNAAFNEPETHYYLVYIGIPSRQDSVSLVTATDINKDFFPPSDFYIEYVDVIDKQTDEWSFETILNGKRPSAEVLSQFIGRFRELVEDIMNHISGRSSHQKLLRLYPQSALPGSIRMKFSSDSNEGAIQSLKIVQRLIQSDEAKLQQQLVEHKINTSQLRDFLTSILRNDLDVEISPKLASDGETIKFQTEQIGQCIEYLDSLNYITVDSIKIPQANDIDKVLEVVKMIDDGTPLVPENIDDLTTQRQVKYYTDAAYALGLITKDQQLTAAGHFLNSRLTKEAKYEVLADRFETTDFGWAWMTWAQVQYMTDLNSETAANFLLACVPTLSKVTANRRASTLRKWLDKLQPYHRKYQVEGS